MPIVVTYEALTTRVPATGSSPGVAASTVGPGSERQLEVAAGERQHVGQRGRADAGDGRGAIEQTRIELAQRSRIAILRARRRDGGGEHVVGVEPHVDVLQRDQRADEQRCADDEHERDRDFGRRRERRAVVRWLSLRVRRRAAPAFRCTRAVATAGARPETRARSASVTAAVKASTSRVDADVLQPRRRRRARAR